MKETKSDVYNNLSTEIIGDENKVVELNRFEKESRSRYTVFLQLNAAQHADGKTK